MLISEKPPLLVSRADSPSPPTPAAAEIASVATPAMARQLHTLGGCLLYGVLKAFFAKGFTVIGGAEGGSEAELSTAAGSDLWAASSAAVDEARVAAMRALLACTSATLYMPAEALTDKPNRLLLAATMAPDPYGKAIFRALVSVLFSYDPVGWGIPYAGTLLGDSHGDVMATAAQLLIVLLSQPAMPAADPPALPTAVREGEGLPVGVPPIDRKVCLDRMRSNIPPHLPW